MGIWGFWRHEAWREEIVWCVVGADRLSEVDGWMKGGKVSGRGECCAAAVVSNLDARAWGRGYLTYLPGAVLTLCDVQSSCGGVSPFGRTPY